MPHVFRGTFIVALVLALAWAFQPASAADVKLTLWRLKTYIPPADKILDTTAQECAKQSRKRIYNFNCLVPCRFSF